MNTKYPKVIEAAVEAGKIIRKYFGDVLELEEKTRASNFRTIADTESEKKILEILGKEYPEYEIFSEECGHNGKKSEYKFVIDPLDGTNNFSLGVPNFTVSIALMKNGTIIFGVVYQPIIDEIFWAEQGRGSWHNGKKLQVSNETSIDHSTIHYDCGYDTDTEIGPAIRLAVGHSAMKRWMENWSIAYDFCLLAQGKTEVIICYEGELYDYAAGWIIAKEAGAVMSNLRGDDIADPVERSLVCNCPETREAILEAFSKVENQNYFLD